MTQTLNQCKWQVVMQAGVVELAVESHTVQITLDGAAAGSLRFRALTSANSDEPPLYRLDTVEILPAVLADARDGLVDASIRLFSQCTGAEVRVSKKLTP